MAFLKSILSLEDKMTPQLSKAEKQAIANAKAYEELNKEASNYKKQLDELYKAGLGDAEISDKLRMAYENTLSAALEYSDGTRNVKIANDNARMSAIELNQSLELLHKGWSMLSGLMQEANGWMQLNNKQFDSEYTLALKMHTALGATPEEIQSMYDYTAALQQNGIIGDEVLMQGAKQLSLSASNVESLKKLTQAAADYAVGEYGIQEAATSYISVAGYMQRALEGSASMLVRNKILTQEQASYIDSLSSRTEKENALIQVFSKYLGQNANATKTAAGQIKQAENSMGDMGEILGQKVIPYFAAFKKAITNAIEPVIQFITMNSDWLIPTILTVVGTIGALIAILTIYQVVGWLTASVNWAMLTPILLVVAGIGLFISVIILAVKALQKWAGISLNIMGIIFSTLFTAFAILQNIGIGIYNTFMGVVTGIAMLFIGLAQVVIGVINGIAKAIDWVFGSNLSQGTEQLMNNLDTWGKNITKGDQFSGFVDIGKAAEEGYKYGENISKGINSGLGGLTSIKDNLDNLSSNFNDVTGISNTGDTALKTTTDDKLLKDEDIQLLLDVATRDYKLSYQQITPNITITFGDIRETVDVDNVLEQVADKLEEIYDGNLEV